MASNIKIGVEVEVKEVKQVNKIADELKRAISSINAAMEESNLDADIKFDSESLNRFARLIEHFNEAVKALRHIMTGDVAVKLNMNTDLEETEKRLEAAGKKSGRALRKETEKAGDDLAKEGRKVGQEVAKGAAKASKELATGPARQRAKKLRMMDTSGIERSVLPVMEELQKELKMIGAQGVANLQKLEDELFETKAASKRAAGEIEKYQGTIKRLSKDAEKLDKIEESIAVAGRRQERYNAKVEASSKFVREQKEEIERLQALGNSRSRQQDEELRRRQAIQRTAEAQLRTSRAEVESAERKARALRKAKSARSGDVQAGRMARNQLPGIETRINALKKFKAEKEAAAKAQEKFIQAAKREVKANSEVIRILERSEAVMSKQLSLQNKHADVTDEVSQALGRFREKMDKAVDQNDLSKIEAIGKLSERTGSRVAKASKDMLAQMRKQKNMVDDLTRSIKKREAAAKNLESMRGTKRGTTQAQEQRIANLRQEAEWLDRTRGEISKKISVNERNINSQERSLAQLNDLKRQHRAVRDAMKTQYTELNRGVKMYHKLGIAIEENGHSLKRLKQLTASGTFNEAQALEAAEAIKKLEGNYKQAQKTVARLNAEQEQQIALLKQQKKARKGHFAGLNKQEAETQLIQKTNAVRDRYNDKIRETKRMALSLSDTIKSSSVQSAKEILRVSKAFNKAGADVDKFRKDINALKRGMKAADAMIAKGGDQALVGAQQMKKFGGQAKRTRDSLSMLVTKMEQQARSSRGLTKEQEKTLKSLRGLRKEFMQASTAVDRQRHSLDRVEKAAKRAGMGFRIYRHELADSIRNNFKFINSMSLIMSAIMGVTMGFMEVLEESRAFARVMTVARSNTMDFEEMLSEVKKQVRQTAIEFGEASDQVAEVIKQFGSAGLEMEEAIAGLQPAMQLITTTQADAEETTRAMAGVYNVFGAQMDNTAGKIGKMTRIADVLTSVYRNHQAELDEMTQGLKFVSATGKVAGFQFEELSAFLAVLNDNLVKSGQAGRTLQRVFAQFAAKSDKFKSALNIGVDSDSPLNEQFVEVLEEVNEQLRNGDTSLTKLRTSFDLFGLRGAKAFEILVENVDDVKETIVELRDESGGLSRELSENVKNSLAKQFQRAKQVLLDFIRSALDPLKEAMVAMVDVLQQFQEALRTLGLEKLLTNLAIWGGIATVLIQSMGAIIMVIGTLATSFGALLTRVRDAGHSMLGLKLTQEVANNEAREMAATNSWLTSTMHQEARAADSAAGANARLGAARKSANAAGGAGKGAAGAAGAGAGVIGGIAIALIGLVAVIGYTTDSMEDLQKSFDKSASNLTKLTREGDKLKKFREEFQELNHVISTTSVETGVAAQRIRDLLKKSNVDLSTKSAYLGLPNEELVRRRGEIIAELQEELGREAVARSKEIAKENAAQIKKLKRIVDKTFGEETNTGEETGSNWWDQAMSTPANFAADIWDERRFEESMDRLDTVRSNIKLLNRDLNELQHFGNNIVLGQKNVNVFGSRDDVKESRELTRRLREIENFRADAVREAEANLATVYSESLQQLNEGTQLSIEEKKEAEEDLRNAVRKQLDEWNKSVEEGDGDVQKRVVDVEKSMQNILNIATKIENTDFAISKGLRPDILKETGGILGQIQETMAGPVGREGWKETAEGIDDARESAEAFRLSLTSMHNLQDRIGTPGGDQLFFADELAKSYTDQFKQMPEGAQAGQLKNMRKNFADVFSESIEDGISEADIDRMGAQEMSDVYGNFIDKYLEMAEVGKDATETMRDNMGRVLLDTEKYVELNRIVSESTFGEGQEGQSETNLKRLRALIVNRQVTKMLAEKRNELFKSYIKMQKTAAERQTTLNTLRRKQLKVDELRQKLDNREDRGIDTAAIDEYLNSDAFRFNFSTADESLVEETYNDQVQSALKILEVRAEGVEMEAEYGAAVEEVQRYLVETNNLIRRGNVELQQKSRYMEGQTATVRDQLRLSRMQADHTLKELKMQEKLVDLKRDENKLSRIRQRALNAEGIEAVQGMLGEQIQLRKELLEATREENAMMFDNLKLSEKILKPEVEKAGIRFDLLKWGRQINHLERRRLWLLRMQQNESIDAARVRSEQIKLDNEALQIYEKYMDLTDEIKEEEEEINDLIDDRIGIYEKLEQVLSQQASKSLTGIQKELQKRLDLDETGFAKQMAQMLGEDVVTVLADTGSAMERLNRSIERGEVNLGKLGAGVAHLGERYDEFSRNQKKVQERIKELQRLKLGRAEKAFRTFLNSGKVEEASKQLDILVSTTQRLFEGNPAKQAEFLEKYAQFGEALAGTDIQEADKEFEVVFEEKGLKLMLSQLDRVQDKVKEIQDRNLGYADLANATFEQYKKMLDENFSGEANLFLGDKEVVSNLNTSLNNLNATIATMNQVLLNAGVEETSLDSTFFDGGRYAKGGPIPGYGGGDQVPALLEMGEYVIPKEIVRKYGLGFFEALRQGRFSLGEIPRFAKGGAVGGGSAKGSTTNALLNKLGEVLSQNMRVTGDRIEHQTETLVKAFNIQAKGIDKLGKVMNQNFIVTGERISQQTDTLVSAFNIQSKGLNKLIHMVHQNFTFTVERIDYQTEVIRAGFLDLSMWVTEVWSRLGDTNQYLYDDAQNFVKFAGFFKTFMKANTDNQVKIGEKLDKLLEAQGGSRKAFTALGFNKGGPIPGYGGGDQVPALLEMGEYVIPKEMVKRYGLGFFEAIRTGKLDPSTFPGFTLGGVAGAVASGAQGALGFATNSFGSESSEVVWKLIELMSQLVDFVAKMQSDTVRVRQNTKDIAEEGGSNGPKSDSAKDLQSQVQQMKESLTKAGVDVRKINIEQLVKSEERQKLTESVLNVLSSQNKLIAASQNREKVFQTRGEESGGLNLSAVFEPLMDQIVNAGDAIEGLLGQVLVPKFASANAKVYEQYLEQLEQIEKQYEQNVKTAEKGLKRNESTYYNYLNSIMDAEAQRARERLRAQEQYRESLRKTSELVRESFGKAFEEIFNPKQVSGIVSELLQPIFGGNLEQQFNELGGAFGFLGDSIAKKLGETDLGKKVASVTDSFKDTFSKKAVKTFDNLNKETKNALFNNLPEGIKPEQIKAGLTDEFLKAMPASSFVADEIGGRLMDVAGQAFDVFGSAVTSMASSLAGVVASGIVQIIQLTMGEETDKMVDFYVDFVEELPEAINQFVEDFDEVFTKLLNTIAENLPVVVNTLVEALPQVVMTIISTLSETLPRIVQTIAQALPSIVQVLVPAILDFFMLIIDQLPAIVSGIVQSIPVIIIEIIKKLPELIWTLIKSIFLTIINIIPNLVKGIGKAVSGGSGGSGPDTFHEGGMIEGRNQEQLIIAQKGEGVLSRSGMRSIGGSKTLDALNSGKIDLTQIPPPRYHSGGTIGRPVRNKPLPVNRGNQGGNQVVDNSQYNITAKVEGGSTGSRRDDKKLAKDLVAEIDKQLAMRAKDRKSELGKQITRDNVGATGSIQTLSQYKKNR